MNAILHIIIEKIKCLRKFLKNCRTAAITPVSKKGNKKLVENYRPVSVLNIDSKMFEQGLYRVFSDPFVEFVTKHQHGFIRKRSVTTNMLSFIQKVYEASDRNSNDDVTIFYSGFSKAFDKLPHKSLDQKLSQKGVAGCHFEVL